MEPTRRSPRLRREEQSMVNCLRQFLTPAVWKQAQETEIMPKEQSSLGWTLPHWHPDYGDTEAEFEHLKSLAVAVLSSSLNSLYKIKYLAPEPGLMYIEVVNYSDNIIIEIYSHFDSLTNKRLYDMFFLPGTNQEYEIHAENTDVAVGALCSQHETGQYY